MPDPDAIDLSPSVDPTPLRKRRGFWRFYALCLPFALTFSILAYYQYENWHGARELEEAHRHMVDRFGTDDFFGFIPQAVPDDQNYFDIPVIRSWMVPPEAGKMCPTYVPPEDLAPKDFIWPDIKGEGSESRLNLEDWSRQRVSAGKTLAAGEAPVDVINRELGDAHGLLPQLAGGLSRPFCCFKPSLSELGGWAGGNPWRVEIACVKNVYPFIRQWCVFARVAAHCGDAKKARETCLVILRFCEGAASHGTLVDALAANAMSEKAFQALADSLACPVWDDSSLTQLQRELSKINDLLVFERGLGNETLQYYEGALWLRKDSGASVFGFGNLLTKYGPVGWYDANIAFHVESMLDLTGVQSDTAWLDSRSRGEALRSRLVAAADGWNPHRVLGAIGMPNLGGFCQQCAERLFQRRALIIGCALERYRLSHGVYPPSLAETHKELSAFHVNDPARPDQPLGYRLESQGYLLWSAGPDARDDGGDPKDDWLWRMKRD